MQRQKYGLINSSGEEKFPTRADDIYMVIDSGTKYYYLNFEDQRYDVEKWLDSIGVKAVKIMKQKPQQVAQVKQQTKLQTQRKTIAKHKKQHNKTIHHHNKKHLKIQNKIVKHQTNKR